ncbi:ankyrin repeat-containing protein ITN1-like [Cucurbita pepo subsp. pepo]|uniref:ankyrin repeat-containing protein ITN1-like n=1 Tax=Cucurbita pepo subsp. pepo TaxID=3664 RepID=UPI000C9DA238|nr:ankyrin repeat-containing protein ITN1-like [Cucurbita pepo subsp. pepo]XP_023551287.1 ankyrin repeat-containing protein ITN1-like [Cucurbita pepo subsp. pepo]XP_023551288.1 ankyrin repeat-containing protein ITN1-like [Cucurbita pepo subsp. pepo]
MGSSSTQVVVDGDEGLEKEILSLSSNRNPMAELSPTPSPSSTSTAPALVLSNSGKRIDQAGKKKYVKQVTGRHNDTELHLAAQRGDLAAVKQILGDIDSQMVRNLSGADLDAEVAEVRSLVVNEVNELGETALFTAAERGHIEVVKELLKYSNKETLTTKNRSAFDPLHIAASQGHHAIVQVLLDHEPSLSKTIGPSNATPLITAAARGHTAVVEELLNKDHSLLEICRSNGKNALHFAVRSGHPEIVKLLLSKDPQLARRNDKKGQTALHMAVKGQRRDVVKLLLDADPAIVMLPDKFGNTALHVATRKKRVEIVQELLLLPDTNVNALSRDHKTAFDIAEELPLSEESSEIKDCLSRHGAVRANELNQPRDELRNTVTQIKKDVHTQLEQTRKTNKNVHNISKELRKLHREGINNATNSVTVVAVLFATVAFAAIFTVPGGDTDQGTAVVVRSSSFKIFFIFNAIALFTSLAVVVVQITLVRGETKAERRVVVIINKLMWLASVCTSVAFMASSYIVVGRKNRWAAVVITVVGGVIMAGVLGTMTYYVVKSKRSRSIRKKEKSNRRSGSNSWHHSDFSNSEVDRIYAL